MHGHGHGGPGGHHRGHGGPGFGGGHHHRPPMGGGMWRRPYRNRGCCGCLFPVIGTVAAFVAMISFLF